MKRNMGEVTDNNKRILGQRLCSDVLVLIARFWELPFIELIVTCKTIHTLLDDEIFWHLRLEDLTKMQAKEWMELVRLEPEKSYKSVYKRVVVDFLPLSKFYAEDLKLKNDKIRLREVMLLRNSLFEAQDKLSKKKFIKDPSEFYKSCTVFFIHLYELLAKNKPTVGDTGLVSLTDLVSFILDKLSERHKKRGKVLTSKKSRKLMSRHHIALFDCLEVLRLRNSGEARVLYTALITHLYARCCMFCVVFCDKGGKVIDSSVKIGRNHPIRISAENIISDCAKLYKSSSLNFGN